MVTERKDWKANLDEMASYLELDPLSRKMLIAASVKYGEDLPRLFGLAMKNTTNAELQTDINTALPMMKRVVALLPMMVGERSIAGDKEVEEAAGLFPEMHGQVMKVLAGIAADAELKEKMRGIAQVVDQQISAAQSASYLITERIKRIQEGEGGLAGHVRKAYRKTEPFRVATGAFGKLSMGMPGEWGGIGDVGMAALLGPFAPIATGAITGTFKVATALRSYFEERRKKKEYINMAKLTVGQTFKEMGTLDAGLDGFKSVFERQRMGLPTGGGPQTLEQIHAGEAGIAPKTAEAMGGIQWPGRDPETGKFVKRRPGVPEASVGGLAAQGMAGAVTLGMAAFFMKQAYESKWTKRVIELLEKTAGIRGISGPEGKGDTNINWFGKIPWGLLTWIARIGAGTAAAYMIGMDAYKGLKEEGENAPLGKKVAAVIGHGLGGGPGLGQKGGIENILSNTVKGALAGFAIGNVAGILPGAVAGLAFGAIGGDRIKRGIEFLATPAGIMKMATAGPIGALGEAAAAEGRKKAEVFGIPKAAESAFHTVQQLAVEESKKLTDAVKGLGEKMGEMIKGIGAPMTAHSAPVPIPYDSGDSFVDELNKGGLDDERQ
jgi:hypothetical protein